MRDDSNRDTHVPGGRGDIRAPGCGAPVICAPAPKISPSMMCADINKLAETLDAFAAAGVEYLHIDVMDGVFVPNYALGTDYVRRLRKFTAIPLDIHLMVERPEDKFEWFEPQPGDIISIHFESTPHVQRALSRIRAAGAKPAVALNPSTHYRSVEHVLGDADMVLVMAVNPGFAGQALIAETLPKISALRKWLDSAGHRRIEIEVDGNVGFDNARSMKAAGVNIFVAGSSCVFAKGAEPRDAVGRLRAVIE